MTTAPSSGWIYSGKQNPCPVCGRTKDGDCRISADRQEVICHHPKDLEPGSVENGWAFTGNTRDGRAGHFTIDKQRGCTGPARVVPFRTETLDQAPIPSPNAAPISGPIELARCQPVDFDPSNRSWRYSPTQRTKRVNGPRGKSFVPHHLNEQEWQRGAGPDPWPAYREADAIQSAGAWVLEAEGEKCADIIRAGGRVAISQPGHAHTVARIKDRYQRLVSAGVLGIVFLEDNDKKGQERSQQSKDAAAAVGLPLVLLPAAEVWPGLPEKGSIDDAPGSAAERVAALEAAIPQALQRHQLQNQRTSAPAEKLADLRALAAKLQADRVGFAERLPTLRHRAGEIGLTIRDSELQGLLAAARRRRLGVDGLLGPGAVLDLSPEPWAWQGLLLRGCLNLLVALPKQGKSSLLISLIGAWHQGANAFLDRELIGPCPPVLLIGTDQGQADWGRMLQAAGLVDPSGRILRPIVGFAHSGRPLHLDPEGIDKIAEYAQQHPGLLVVIDSLSACIAPLGLKEESPEIAMPVAELMEQLEPHGATVVLIHHASKGRAGDSATSASRGSTALPALASQVLKLAPANPSNPRDNRRVLTTEGRGGSPQALVIERAGADWLLHGGAEALEQERQQAETIRKLTDRQADALDLLRDRWADHQQRTTAAELAEALGLKPIDSALRTLQQLQRKGLAQSIRLPDRLGARGPYAFGPTTDGQQSPSRGAVQNTVGSVGSVGSEALAHEDPQRAAQLDPCIDPTTDASDTSDTQKKAPARGAEQPSVVDLRPTTTTDWVRLALRELRLAPQTTFVSDVMAWLDQIPEQPGCTRSAVFAAMVRLQEEDDDTPATAA
jgi:hypothetical protein